MKTFVNFISKPIFIGFCMLSSYISYSQEFTIRQDFTGNSNATIRGQSFSPEKLGTGTGTAGAATYVAIKNIKVVYSGGMQAPSIHLYKLSPSVEELNQGIGTYKIASSSSKTIEGIYTVYHFEDLYIKKAWTYYALFSQNVSLEHSTNLYDGGQMYVDNLFNALADLKFIVTLEVKPLPEFKFIDSQSNIDASWSMSQQIFVNETFTKTFKITNAGQSRLRITEITFSNLAFSSPSILPSFIEPNSYAEFIVEMTPTDDISYYSSLKLATNDPTKEPAFYNFYVHGRHYAYPPTDPIAQSYSNTGISVSWTPPQIYGVQEVHLERSINNTSQFSLLTKLKSSEYNFMDDSLLSSNTYHYRLRSEKDGRLSEYSEIITASPTADLSIGDWEPIPRTLFLNHLVVAQMLGPKLFVAGGLLNNEWFADVFECDVDKGTKIPRAIFPGGPRSSMTSFAIDGIWYLGLGISSNKQTNTWEYKKDMYKYDPATDTWSAIPVFPGAARGSAAAFVINNKAYIGLGRSDQGNFTDLFEFDPSNNTWRQMTSVPPANDLSLSKDGMIYNGQAYLPSNQEMYRFDPNSGSTGTWTKLGTCPRWVDLGFVFRNKGYVVTGTRVFEYNFSSDTWTRLRNTFPHGSNARAIVLNGRLLVYSDFFFEFFPNSPRPPKPSSTRVANGITLTFKNNTERNSGFQIQRATAPSIYTISNSGQFVTIADVAKNQTTFLDVTVEKNKLYEYRLVNKFPAGNSASNFVRNHSFDSLELKLTKSSSGVVSLNWPNIPVAAHYKIDTALTNSYNPPKQFTRIVNTTNANSILFSNLTPDWVYHFKASASLATFGDIPPRKSKWMAVLNKPTELVANVVNETYDVEVKWTDNCSIETGYVLERKSKSIPFQQIKLLAANTTDFIDPSLQFNQYTYRVRAILDTLNSENSNEYAVNVITSLEERSVGHGAYPNPTQGKVILKGAKEVDGIEVISLEGIAIRVQYENVVEGALVDLSRFRTGIYFIQTRTKGRVQTFKVLKY